MDPARAGERALASLMLSDGSLQAAPIAGEAADPPPHSAGQGQARDPHLPVRCAEPGRQFDYKPELVRLHGKSLVTDEKPDVFFGQVGLLREPDWEFQQRGQSGLWV